MEPNKQKSTKGAMAVAIDLDRTTSRPGNRKVSDDESSNASLLLA